MGNANASKPVAERTAKSENTLGKPPFQYATSHTATPRSFPRQSPRENYHNWAAAAAPPPPAAGAAAAPPAAGVQSELWQVPVTPRTMQYIQTLSFEDQQRYLASLAGRSQQAPPAQQAAFVNQDAQASHAASHAMMGGAGASFYGNYGVGAHQQQQSRPKEDGAPYLGPASPFTARYSILLPGSEHLISDPTLLNSNQPPVYRTSFSGTADGEYLCISPDLLSQPEVLNMTVQEVVAYGARVPTVAKQLSFTSAQMAH